jgi:hypothetical protein
MIQNKKITLHPSLRLRRITFTNIKVPENAKVIISDTERVKFTNVKSKKSTKPLYMATNSTKVSY